jgi:lipid A ethanolaminephosphotransferase
MKRLSGIRLSHHSLAALVALYFATVINLPIYLELKQIFADSAQVSVLFAISIPLFFWAVFNLLLQLMSWPYLAKPILALLTFIAGALCFGTLSYGLVYDTNMLINAMETNASEAGSYQSVNLWIWIFFLGILPALLILLIPLKKPASVGGFLLKKLGMIVLSLVIIGVIAALCYKDYASVGRNNSYLRKMIIPNEFVYSGYKLARDELKTPVAFKRIGLDATLDPAAQAAEKPNLLVLVIGETARAQNVSYYGYERDTNPFTRPLDPIVIGPVESCGTATATSLPCMLSLLNRTDYDRDVALNQDNVLALIKRAGVDVTWIDNDGGDKLQALGLTSVKINNTVVDINCNGTSCFDQIIINEMPKAIQAMSGNRVLVLHLIGSHGPTYFERYPKNMEAFTPACSRSDIENCTSEQIVNTYDNTIRYTDFINAEVIKYLKTQEAQFDVSAVYLSDHGESLGENGLYLHGLPYNMAPDTQKRVPMLMWLSEGAQKRLGVDEACLRTKGKESGISHDNLFHTLLGLAQVNTEVRDDSLNLLTSCQ